MYYIHLSASWYDNGDITNSKSAEAIYLFLVYPCACIAFVSKSKSCARLTTRFFTQTVMSEQVATKPPGNMPYAEEDRLV